jgi:Tfp pilus assembly protein PilO
MNTKNIAVGALAAVLTLALWYNFLLKPTQSQASKVKSDTAAKKEQLVPLQAQLDQANADAASAGTFKAQLASLQTAVPNSPALAAFIRDANAIASAAGVSWQSVTHAPPVAGSDGISTIQVGITVKGTYEQVMDYITRLNALKRLLVVDTVQFSAGADAGASTGAGAGSATGAATGGSDQSTGPFSGASQLVVTVSARMFEMPPPVVSTGDGTGTTTGTGTASTSTGASSSTGTAQTSTLNNS